MKSIIISTSHHFHIPSHISQWTQVDQTNRGHPSTLEHVRIIKRIGNWSIEDKSDKRYKEDPL